MAFRLGSLKTNLSNKKPFGAIPSGFCFSGCLRGIALLRQPETGCAMARRRLVDILPTSKVLLSTPFGGEPSPCYFQAALDDGLRQPENV
ncbi:MULTISPECIES: hypothetical protein [Kingella]|uniref:Uncharacterized protein n=1 Tax=Kingella bonacorsii TaxID=2796361 RepID=A0ABS1BR71_9NEIS|nr:MULTISPECIES: hypothetical protein [Kingella]MBK0395780.1 hypothetical protein [Kingella bonacorsii]QMT41972.1 hypothetical protein H3L93_07995 [Kingella oralis]